MKRPRMVKKEEKRESRDFGSEFGSAEKDSGRVWSTWEELYSSWAWQSNVVDEQMSWGSVWLPVWDLDIVGEAFDALYSDVVWDDDIWDLRNQIPYPYM
ncbi:uncharacterized protein G2W53_018979 [Senna tora]|uniref:Uncharacterized protein n=1 Tax=Senna tora TaxID=362788 RepID=A0A834TWU7_9FABA|nr:uncharacterized protein G2W53_018979 [Senna tora]